MIARNRPTRAPGRLFKPQRESALSRQVAEWWPAVLPAGWIATTVPNGGERNKIVGAQIRGEGLNKGFPDWVFLGLRTKLGHNIVTIELKREGVNALRPEQIVWRDAIRAAGIPWFLCHTLDEVAAALSSCGIPLRCRERGL